MQRKRAPKKKFVHFTPFETVDAQKVLGEKSQAYKRFKNMALVVPAPMRRNLFSSLRAVQKHDPAYTEALKQFSRKLPLHAARLTPSQARDLREAATRVNTLASLLEMEKELKIPPAELQRVLHEPNLKPLIQGLFKEYFIKRGLGIDIPKFHDDALRVISNPEMISRSLAYNKDYRGDRNNRQVYLDGWKAFLTEGRRGVKKYKFSKAMDVFKDEKMASFVSDIDRIVGNIRPGGEVKEINLQEHFRGKLADFESHSKEVDMKQLIAQDKTKLDKALKEIDMKALGVDKEALVQILLKQDVEAINQFMGKLKGKQIKGKAGRLKGALLGALSNHVSVLNSVKAFGIARELHKMPKGREAQYKFLEGLQEKFGKETIVSLGKLFESLSRKNPKPIYGDLSFFMENIHNPPRPVAAEESGEVHSRITYDLADLLRVGKFEKNCQNTGNSTHNHGLLSFSFDPAELTLAHYSGGEIIGFSFAHVVKGKKKNYLVIERAYSDHGNLKPEMNAQREEMARRITEAAKKAGLNLRGGTKEQLKGKEVETFPSAYNIGKYYDIAGGSVSGWRSSFTIRG